MEDDEAHQGGEDERRGSAEEEIESFRVRVKPESAEREHLLGGTSNKSGLDSLSASDGWIIRSKNLEDDWFAAMSQRYPCQRGKHCGERERSRFFPTPTQIDGFVASFSRMKCSILFS